MSAVLAQQTKKHGVQHRNAEERSNMDATKGNVLAEGQKSAYVSTGDLGRSGSVAAISFRKVSIPQAVREFVDSQQGEVILYRFNCDAGETGWVVTTENYRLVRYFVCDGPPSVEINERRLKEAIKCIADGDPDTYDLRVVLSRPNAQSDLRATEKPHHDRNESSTGNVEGEALRNLTDEQKRMVLDCGWSLKAAVQRVAAGETPAVLGTAHHVEVVNRLSLEELKFFSSLYDLEQEATRVGQAGDHQKAIALFKQLAAKAPWHSIALMSIGVLYAFQDQEDEAFSYLHRALQVDPENQQIKQNLRQVEQKFGVSAPEVQSQAKPRTTPGDSLGAKKWWEFWK